MTAQASGMTLLATPPSIRTAFRPSWYSRPSITGRRGSYAASAARIGAAAWTALEPIQLRAEWARSPAVCRMTRRVPWQPPSTWASEGSRRTAKSPSIQSGCASATCPRPLRCAATSSLS
ncbi:hypothetical protein A8W25_12385 [Streptomyces sp. ERV7]|nr:hypothetical protein A8W25_12385 [Streptomyces sp. ERV7]